MKIIADENILGAEACLGQFGDVELVAGRSVTSAQLVGAQALVVRSVTRVNRDLLAGSGIGFVGTCTIGTDHLDTAFLRERGIAFCSAPGSNADSVVDYVLSALANPHGLLEDLLQGARVGIVGLGNVGRRLAARLQGLGIGCDAYDPFLDPVAHPILRPLDALKRCRVLCLHTPLTTTGPFPTRHLLDSHWLAALPARAVILNAGRGEALATQDLLSLKAKRPDIQLVLDVWENEPRVDPVLAGQCLLATPHIAGYSADGKLKGLHQVAAALARHLGVAFVPPAPPPDLQQGVGIALQGHTVAEKIRSGIAQVYDICSDDQRFRQGLAESEPAAAFDRLRKTYPRRRELNTATLIGGKAASAGDRALFKALTGQ